MGAPRQSTATPTTAYSYVAPGFCGTVDYTVAELQADAPSMYTTYQTTMSSTGTNGWYTQNGLGAGMCYIRSVDNCAAICGAVSGCAYFSTSTTASCYACFLYKTCPNPSTSGAASGPDYGVYQMVQSGGDGSAYVFAQASSGPNEVRLTGPNNVISWNSFTPGLAPVDCLGVGDGQLTCTGTVESGGDIVTETGASLDAVAAQVLFLQEFLGLYPPSAPPAIPPPALPPYAPWTENVTFGAFVPAGDPTIGVLASTGEVYFKSTPNSLTSTNGWPAKMAFPLQVVAPSAATYRVRLYQRKGNVGDGAPFTGGSTSLCQHAYLDVNADANYQHYADSFFICASDPRSTPINPDPGTADFSSCRVYHAGSTGNTYQTFALSAGVNTLWLASRETCALAVALSLTLDYHYTPVPIAPFRPTLFSWDPKVGIYSPSDPAGPYKLDDELYFDGITLSPSGASMVAGVASFPVQIVVPHDAVYVVNLDIREGSNVFSGTGTCTHNDINTPGNADSFYICPTGATRTESELNSDCGNIQTTSASTPSWSLYLTAGVNTMWIVSRESCTLGRIMHVKPQVQGAGFRPLTRVNAFMSTPPTPGYPASQCIDGSIGFAQESSAGSCMTSLQTDPSITIDLGSIQDIDYVAVYVVSRTGRARLGHHTVSYLEDHTQWHLAPSGSSYCDYGDNALVSECQVAGNLVASEAGQTPERTMQGPQTENSCNPSSAAWDGIPDGCSVQTGTSDWSAHYRTSTIDCAGSSNYQLVCSGAYTECSSYTHMYDDTVEDPSTLNRIRTEFVHGCPARARYVKVTFPGYQPPYPTFSGDSSANGRVLELTEVKVHGPPLTGRRLDQPKATEHDEAQGEDATRLHRRRGSEPPREEAAAAKARKQQDAAALSLIADQPDPTYTNVLFTDGELTLVSTAPHDADASRDGTLILWSEMPFAPWVATARFQLGGQKNSAMCGFTSYHGPDESVPHMELAITARCPGDGSLGSVRFGTNHFGSALPSLTTTASRDTCEPGKQVFDGWTWLRLALVGDKFSFYWQPAVSDEPPDSGWRLMGMFSYSSRPPDRIGIHHESGELATGTCAVRGLSVENRIFAPPDWEAAPRQVDEDGDLTYMLDLSGSLNLKSTGCMTAHAGPDTIWSTVTLSGPAVLAMIVTIGETELPGELIGETWTYSGSAFDMEKKTAKVCVTVGRGNTDTVTATFHPRRY